MFTAVATDSQVLQPFEGSAVQLTVTAAGAELMEELLEEPLRRTLRGYCVLQLRISSVQTRYLRLDSLKEDLNLDDGETSSLGQIELNAAACR